MKVIITGAKGQLGLALQRHAPRGMDVIPYARADLDIADARAVEFALVGADALINAAAYTDVESAELNAADAFRVNSEGAANLASACATRRIRLVHVSTDFVFDGTKEMPYLPNDEPHPLNVYGASKLEGEQRVLKILPEACVVRTSWVHSADTANFVTKIVQRMRAGAAVRVVTDEVGSPTATHSLAVALWACVARPLRGIHHWSDAGSVNRFDYACAIARLAVENELVPQTPAISPARAAEFAGGAKRPRYSVLATADTEAALGIRTKPWLEGLRLTMQDLRHKQSEP